MSKEGGGGLCGECIPDPGAACQAHEGCDAFEWAGFQQCRSRGSRLDVSRIGSASGRCSRACCCCRGPSLPVEGPVSEPPLKRKSDKDCGSRW
jgi:hypothetical protein